MAQRGRPPKEGSEAWLRRQAEWKAKQAEAQPEAKPKPKGEDGYVVHNYKSINEFIDAAKSKWTNLPDNRGHAQKHFSEKYGDWYGLPEPMNFPMVQRLIQDGWVEGAKKLFHTSEQVKKPALESIRRKMVWKDQGEEISLDRLYAGEFDTMWRGFKSSRRKEAGRIVRLACNVSANSLVGSEQMFWTGACVVVLADILTNAGFSVQVDLVMSSRNRQMESDKLAAITTVKEPDQPLSIAGLASTLCLAGYFRSIGLVWLWKHYSHEASVTCGTSTRYEIPGDGIIQVAHGDVENQADCVAWVEDKLSAFA